MAVAELDTSRESTWFNGYNEKYFYDRGILHSVIYKKKLKLRILVNIFNWVFIKRHQWMLSKNITEKKALEFMASGTKEYYTEWH